MRGSPYDNDEIATQRTTNARKVEKLTPFRNEPHWVTTVLAEANIDAIA